MSAISGSAVPQTDVLVLCTANVCRSPMAEVLLASRLAARDAAVHVHSAGQLAGGEPVHPQTARAMARFGLDLAPHRGRQLTVADVAAADLIIAMARANLRHAVVLDPEAWPRAFTLKELVRRGEAIGPRASGQSLACWLASAHHGRERTTLLGDSAADDIADPAGGSQRAYDRTAAELSRLVDMLVDCCWKGVGMR